MTTRTRTIGAAVVAAGLVWAMTACSSTVDGAAEGETQQTVTEIVTETAAPSTTASEEPTTEPEASLPQASETSTESAVPPSSVDEPELEQPTNPPAASDACATSDLDISLEIDGGAAGSVIYDLIFTNTGASDCTMQGFPDVTYVRGDKGIQVGGPATRDGAVGDIVTLAPGGSATAMLQQVDVYNFDEADCHPVKVRGLRVYPPGQDAAAFVPQDGAVGCKTTDLPGGQFQMSVQSVMAG